MSEYSAPRAEKRRGAPRGPRAATLALRERILSLIEEVGPPLTLRQVHYLASGRNLYAKTDPNYRKLGRNLGDMREDGSLPWEWIADNTRWVRQAEAWDSPAAALDDMHRTYRRDYWRLQPVRVEVWVESDSIASFVCGITDGYGLPLFVCRGQASKTFVYEAARQAQQIGKPQRIIYLGDWDPTGVRIDASLQERLTRYTDGSVDLQLERVAITARQIITEGLPTHGTVKARDPNRAAFIELCQVNGLPIATVETEARDPNLLRQDLDDAIRRHIDWAAWNSVRAYETLERNQLANMVESTLDGWNGGDAR